MAAPLNANTVLNGKYSVIRLAGGGGMAYVYQVQVLNEPVLQLRAVKELQFSANNQKDQEEALRQFHQEAKLLEKLNHPNLPKVMDYFEENSRSYFVMEFVEGETLEQILKSFDRPLPERLVLEWVLEICNVLTYLHGQQPPIIFRDMKPSNIMLSRRGEIKLIDFGIARTFKTGKKKDTIFMGSDNYAPWEQYGKGQTDACSDIYALGATTYHMVTNTLPLPCSFPSPKPRTLNPALSHSTEEIILRAMSRTPKDRYQSAQAMAEAVTLCHSNLDEQPADNKSFVCPECQQSIRPQASFCGHCGAFLGPLQINGVIQVMGFAGPIWEVPIQKNLFTIGRKSEKDGNYPDLDLAFYDQDYLSRCHAQIHRSERGLFLMDLGSANGTFVNGGRLSAHSLHPLRNGDRIRVGKVNLLFYVAAK